MSDFKFSATRTENYNKTFPNADAWTVRVTNPSGKVMQRKYYMGYGHNGATPKLADVMESLITDAASYADAKTPEAFMREFGFEEYSHAVSAFNACKRTYDKLETFLTPEEREAFTEY